MGLILFVIYHSSFALAAVAPATKILTHTGTGNNVSARRHRHTYNMQSCRSAMHGCTFEIAPVPVQESEPTATQCSVFTNAVERTHKLSWRWSGWHTAANQRPVAQALATKGISLVHTFTSNKSCATFILHSSFFIVRAGKKKNRIKLQSFMHT